MAVRLTVCGVLLRVESLKAFFYAGVVDTQELVLRSSHADKIRLALATFLIEELVHRLLSRRLFQISANNLLHRFP